MGCTGGLIGFGKLMLMAGQMKHNTWFILGVVAVSCRICSNRTGLFAQTPKRSRLRVDDRLGI